MSNFEYVKYNSLKYTERKLQTFLLLTLLKLSFFLSDLNNSFLKYTTLHSPQPTLLATLALSLMDTLLSPTKFMHFLNPATITFVNFAVSAHISTSKRPAPLPPPLSTRYLSDTVNLTPVHTAYGG